MNGAEVKCAVISDLPLSMAARPSLWPSETVQGSSLPCSPGPNAFSAAICSVIAWIETFTAGSAMRSLAVKSLIDLHVGIDGVEIERHGVDRRHALDRRYCCGCGPRW